jgi:hypothetical protein
MAIFINIKFPDGSSGVGPFLATEPTPKDLSTWHRLAFSMDGEELAVYHQKSLSRENVDIVFNWSASQRKKKVT